VGEGVAASRWLRLRIPAAKLHGGSVPRSGVTGASDLDGCGAEGPTEFEEEIDELAVFTGQRDLGGF
jgi:hypothetical protein